jgi:phosphatidate cytidylyltransferase
MLRTRLIAGSLLAAAMGAVLVADAQLAPYYPCLFACVLLMGALCAHEFRLLLPVETRPPAVLSVGGVLLLIASNWYFPVFAGTHSVEPLPRFADPWRLPLFVFTALVMAALLDQMMRYREPGTSIARVANAVLLFAYLGLLPGLFAQLRWLPDISGLALTAAIFVPKVGDIGAYFTGRFLGRHKFSPLLSPKKTWEGFIGGMVAAAGTAVGLSYAGPLFPGGLLEAVAFGWSLGLAGVLGDLAESMLKRDAQVKDAAKSVPGFGGVLDVVDSVLFAAPVAYWWLSFAGARG